MARALQLVLLVIVLAACQRAAAPPARGSAPAVDALADARAAMDRREWSLAAVRLREIIAADPRQLEAHFRLGISASHLDLVDEARREFEWVVANDIGGTPEVKVARDWLAGLRAAPTDIVVSPGDSTRGGVRGSVVWGEERGSLPLARQQLFLKGLPGTTSADEYLVLRTAPDGAYAFTDVVPGPYMVTDRIAGAPRWRLRVLVTSGGTVRLDLGPENSLTRRDDFPAS